MDASILVDEAAAVGGDVGNVDAGAEIAVGRADSAETTRSAWASWDGDADGEKGTIAMEIYRSMSFKNGQRLLQLLKALQPDTEVKSKIPESYKNFAKLTDHQKQTLEKFWTTKVKSNEIRRRVWDDFSKEPDAVGSAGDDVEPRLTWNKHGRARLQELRVDPEMGMNWEKIGKTMTRPELDKNNSAKMLLEFVLCHFIHDLNAMASIKLSITCPHAPLFDS